MAAKDERRKSPRFDVAWPIEVAHRSAKARGETANISRGGAFFKSFEPLRLKPGSVVDVRIDVPADASAGRKGETIVGRAHVVRLEEFPDGCGIALHFSEELDALPASPDTDK